MKYQTILFDADGTLFDFKRAERVALSDLLAHFHLPDSQEIHKLYSAANAEQWALLEKKLVTRDELRVNRFRNFCKAAGFPDRAEAMKVFYENALSQKRFLIDGALNICQILSHSCDLYIVTNGFRHIQMERFSQSPLLPYFKHIFISQDIGVEKPDPAFFEYVEAHIEGFKKDSTLVVGDSLSSDIAGGLCYNLDTCWFNPDRHTAPSNIQSTYTISSLCELQQIIS